MVWGTDLNMRGSNEPQWPSPHHWMRQGIKIKTY